ncbi:MAG: 4-hydroxy-tetrahydrodipicolinate synthase [Actinomycetota bacterium]
MDARATFGTVLTAMVTPFHADGSMDLDSAARLADHLVAAGCDGLVVSGTTGESPTTHGPEKVDLVRAVVGAVGGRAKVVAGAGSNDTAHAVRMAECAADAGADALLVVSPYYNRPSQEGVAVHIETVASATDLPVLLYDIPGRTGVAIGPAASARLARHPNILAVKDAAGNAVAGCRRGRETGLAVYSGDDPLNLSFLTHGAVGVVSVVGHVAADRYRRMVDAVAASDLAGALAVHDELAPLVDAIMGTGQGAVLAKYAVHELGLIRTARLRLPLVPPTDEQRTALLAAMRALGHLG